jgi:enoyl-CoA hydratase
MGHVRLEIATPGVATLTLSGADPLNIFDIEMRDELIEAIGAVRDHPDVAAVILRAEGRHFSAGADLREFGAEASTVERRRIRWDRDPWTPLWELPQPTIAALHGVAMGAGLEMSMLCDIRLAAPDVVLSLPEPRIGMLPSAGGTQSALRTIGVSRALSLCLLADRLGVDAALEAGLVHDVCEDVDGAALALAARLAALPARAARSAKVLAHAALERSLSEGLRLERLHAALSAQILERSTRR